MQTMLVYLLCVLEMGSEEENVRNKKRIVGKRPISVSVFLFFYSRKILILREM